MTENNIGYNLRSKSDPAINVIINPEDIRSLFVSHNPDLEEANDDIIEVTSNAETTLSNIEDDSQCSLNNLTSPQNPEKRDGERMTHNMTPETIETVPPSSNSTEEMLRQILKQVQETKEQGQEQGRRLEKKMEDHKVESKEQGRRLEKKMEDHKVESKEQAKELENRITKTIQTMIARELTEIKTTLHGEISNITERQKVHEEKIKEDFQDLRKEVDTQIQTQVEQEKINFRADAKQIIALECSTYHKEINEQIKTNKRVVEETQQDINFIKNNLEEQREEIHSLKQEQKHKPNYPSIIQVTCTGNGQFYDSNLPKFSGKNMNPQEFIKKLKTAYEKTKQLNQNTNKSEEEILHDLIDMCIDQSASKWWELAKEEIHTFTDFVKEFESKYWNRDIQRSVRQKLETERYRPGGRLNRSEYFIDRVLTMKSLIPAPSEEEIVDRLAEHFSDLVQDAKRVQNITSIRDFELLLQREDMKDKQQTSKIPQTSNFNKNMKTRYNEQKSPAISYQTNYNQGRPQDNVNHQAYQPRKTDYHKSNQQRREYTKDQHQPNQKTYDNSYHPSNNCYGQNQQSTSHHDSYNPNRRYDYSYQNKANYRDNKQTNYPTREQQQVCHLVAENPTSQYQRGNQNLTPEINDNYPNQNQHLNGQALTDK